LPEAKKITVFDEKETKMMERLKVNQWHNDNDEKMN
jgi:hypothetical protein